jgi:hypothetical protein
LKPGPSNSCRSRLAFIIVLRIKSAGHYSSEPNLFEGVDKLTLTVVLLAVDPPAQAALPKSSHMIPPLLSVRFLWLHLMPSASNHRGHYSAEPDLFEGGDKLKLTDCRHDTHALIALPNEM